jgi:hypothetical protein
MKIKALIIIQIFFIISLISCISFNTSNEQMEGITDNTLKIIIAEFFPFEEKSSNEKIESVLKQKLNERASLVIASYISINLSRNKISPKVDITLNNLINEVLAQGKLINYHCTENNHCTAHAEYNINELIKNLSSINNQ